MYLNAKDADVYWNTNWNLIPLTHEQQINVSFSYVLYLFDQAYVQRADAQKYRWCSKQNKTKKTKQNKKQW